MSTTLLKRSGPLPRVARLGFDDGWLLLSPTFLNLRVPVVVVDHAHTGDPYSFGLKPFAACDPSEPLPATNLVISWYGDLIAIRTRSTPEILASTCLHDCCLSSMIATHREAVLFIGSTYELQSTWATLWTMSTGTATITNHEESSDYV